MKRTYDLIDVKVSSHSMDKEALAGIAHAVAVALSLVYKSDVPPWIKTLESNEDDGERIVVSHSVPNHWELTDSGL